MLLEMERDVAVLGSLMGHVSGKWHQRKVRGLTWSPRNVLGKPTPTASAAVRSFQGTGDAGTSLVVQ